MFEKALTNHIQIEVQSSFVAEHSQPDQERYFFKYLIQIHNLGQQPVQLLSRHWIITDGQGRIEEVRGPGVIGQQPTIAPGESFQYESFCPLTTPTGTMRGTYQMSNQDGSQFDVQIPQFFLVEPSSYH